MPSAALFGKAAAATLHVATVCAVAALAMPDWVHAVVTDGVTYDMGLWQVSSTCDLPAAACGPYGSTTSYTDLCDDNPDSVLCSSAADAARGFAVMAMALGIAASALHIHAAVSGSEHARPLVGALGLGAAFGLAAVMSWTYTNACPEIDPDGAFDSCMYGGGYGLSALGMMLAAWAMGVQARTKGVLMSPRAA